MLPLVATISRISSLKKSIIIAGIVVVVLAGGFYLWGSHGSEKLLFTSAPVKRGDVVATVGATGTLEPLEVVDVGAQVAGRISAFGTDTLGKTTDYGSIVQEGSLLAKIDDSVYAADLSVAKAETLSAAANLEEMKAKLDLAEADWKRSQELYKSKLISESDYDTARANEEIAKANV